MFLGRFGVVLGVLGGSVCFWVILEWLVLGGSGMVLVGSGWFWGGSGWFWVFLDWGFWLVLGWFWVVLAGSGLLLSGTGWFYSGSWVVLG